MRIAIFIYCLRGGGAHQRTLTLAGAFAERGHAIDVVVVSADHGAGVALSKGVRAAALG